MPLDSKSNRILEIYQQLQMGRVVNKRDAAEKYGVNARSIQRDIEDIRLFLAEQATQNGTAQSIQYDARNRGYRLETQEETFLSGGELLAVCKILIESRAFSKTDITSLLGKILRLGASHSDRAQVEDYISNEIFNYANPAHPPLKTDFLWEVAQAIKKQHILEISYIRLKEEKVVTRKVEPVGILFSEYYFYLMAFIVDKEKRKNFDKENDPFPTIYRLDRIQRVTDTGEKFKIPYKDRFKEGEYKNRVQFMYGGELQEVEFKYYGPSIEAVLDKLPLARVIEEKERVYTVKAETFGRGILMWLLSQGSRIEVIGPADLKMKWLDESLKILKREDSKR